MFSRRSSRGPLRGIGWGSYAGAREVHYTFLCFVLDLLRLAL